MPVRRKMRADASTDAESKASNEASEPDATSASEFSCFPLCLTYCPIRTFTSTATAMMTRPTALYCGVSGCSIFLTDSTSELKPA